MCFFSEYHFLTRIRRAYFAALMPIICIRTYRSIHLTHFCSRL